MAAIFKSFLHQMNAYNSLQFTLHQHITFCHLQNSMAHDYTVSRLCVAMVTGM